MPHIRLEHSANLIEKDTLHTLFPKVHALLAEHLPTTVRSCKSRVIPCEHVYLGDGNHPESFVHVEVKVKQGRTPETLTKVADHLMELLRTFFDQSATQTELDISIEIVEVSDIYVKWSME